MAAFFICFFVPDFFYSVFVVFDYVSFLVYSDYSSSSSSKVLVSSSGSGSGATSGVGGLIKGAVI